MRSGITNQISCSKDTENRTANADYAHNAMRQETTLHQWAQYWQQNNIYSNVIECVLNYTLTYTRKQGCN